MRNINAIPAIWTCDYCQCSDVAYGDVSNMPSAWKRLMLDTGRYVDVCPNCLDDAISELKKMGVCVVSVYGGKERNENKRKKDFRRRVLSGELDYLDNKANEMNAKAYDISGLVDVTVTKMR